jgi:hypothetical protein
LSTKKLQIIGSLGSNVEIDTTLAEEGKAADAKAVGDALVLKADQTSFNVLSGLVGDIAVAEQVNTAIEALDADDLGIYVQSEEPIGAEDGSVWIDLNETFNDNTLATEEYVNTAIANHITDTELILHSASGKKFKLTIDDEGVLTATEIVESVM